VIADLTLRAKRIHVEGHEVQLEGVVLDDLVDQLEVREIVELFGVKQLLEEIGEGGMQSYYEEEG
jgi:hypothetical protein